MGDQSSRGDLGLRGGGGRPGGLDPAIPGLDPRDPAPGPGRDAYRMLIAPLSPRAYVMANVQAIDIARFSIFHNKGYARSGPRNRGFQPIRPRLTSSRSRANSATSSSRDKL